MTFGNKVYGIVQFITCNTTTQKDKKVDTKLLFVSVLEKKRNKNHFEIYKNYFHVKLVHHEKMSKKLQTYVCSVIHLMCVRLFNVVIINFRKLRYVLEPKH